MTDHSYINTAHCEYLYICDMAKLIRAMFNNVRFILILGEL